MTTPQFRPDHAENDQARLANGGHVVRCTACRYDWVCCCAAPECLFAGKMCDDCGWEYLEASDDAEENGHYGDPLHPDHDLVTLEVDTSEGRVAIDYRDGTEVERRPVVAGSGA